MNIFIIVASVISGYLSVLNFQRGYQHLFKTPQYNYQESSFYLETSWYQNGAILLVGGIALFMCGIYDHFDKGIMLVIFSIYSMQALVLLFITIKKYKNLFKKIFPQLLMLLLTLALISLGAMNQKSL